MKTDQDTSSANQMNLSPQAQEDRGFQKNQSSQTQSPAPRPQSPTLSPPRPALKFTREDLKKFCQPSASRLLYQPRRPDWVKNTRQQPALAGDPRSSFLKRAMKDPGLVALLAPRYGVRDNYSLLPALERSRISRAIVRDIKNLEKVLRRMEEHPKTNPVNLFEKDDDLYYAAIASIVAAQYDDEQQYNQLRNEMIDMNLSAENDSNALEQWKENLQEDDEKKAEEEAEYLLEEGLEETGVTEEGQQDPASPTPSPGDRILEEGYDELFESRQETGFRQESSSHFPSQQNDSLCEKLVDSTLKEISSDKKTEEEGHLLTQAMSEVMKMTPKP